MNIQTHANTLNKASKQYIQNSIVEMYETATEQQKETLAFMYKYFMPAQPKKCKTASEWVYKAVAKEIQRPCLQFTYCDGKNIVATNGHRMHFSPAPENLEEGYYDVRLNKIENMDYTYPQYERVIPNVSRSEKFDVSKLEVKKDTSPSKYVYIIEAPHVVVKLDKRYLEDALNGENEFTVSFEERANERSPALIETKFGTAVIMPVK